MSNLAEAPLPKPLSEDGQRFRGGKLRTDAGPRPPAERQVLETMPPALVGEALDLERVGLIPIFAVTMDHPWPDGNDVPRFHLMLADPVPSNRLPVEARYRRVKPHRLAQEQPQPRHPVRDIVIAQG